MKEIRGYVIGKTQGVYTLLADGKRYNVKLRGSLKKNKDKLNCIIGDYVEFSDFIEKVEERKNFLLRPLIANIDYVAMVYSAKNPDFDFISFQKNLLWIDKQRVKRILILNKMDLEMDGLLEKIQKQFINLKIFPISLKEKTGLKELEEFLENKHIVLSGLSGVGKSSLINYLLREELANVGSISEKTKKGKNTTILTKYYNKNNMILFDTPGYSSIDFPNFENKKDIRNYFIEFENEHCKFRDCLHLDEPNCAIKEAVLSGAIDEERYEFYKYVIRNFE
ncbi:ribosome small subunit-dependent GTPase A [Sneathia sanguinegens]|uniref:ribosome small subunit-dependent GTPase A n=1 Tax=Sneathia sanguinegens TaxID=40543 RepID=UPI00291591D2|nr:ribosome small subunit-dependent GTPase A [Sneathia sanguinegens]MDU7497309.1 ribosome small subunit-dependent GTPase A [Sneathia sanguinegens]